MERGVFRGREVELADLVGAIDELRAGQGFVLMLEGVAGIGKTRLVDEALARIQGVATWRAAAHPLEAGRAFGMVLDALNPKNGSPSPRRSEQPEWLDLDHIGDSPEARHAVARRIVDAVERAAQDAPMLVVLEDLQWVDAASPLVLTGLARASQTTPIGLVLSARPAPLTEEFELARNWIRERGAKIVHLGPLPEPAVTEVAQDVLDAKISKSLSSHMQAAGGNPLFVTELLAALQEEGLIRLRAGTADLARSSLTPSIKMTLLRRLGFLPRETLAVLRVAAVLGRRFSLRELARVSGIGSADLLVRLEPALLHGFLTGAGSDFSFTHDLIQEALYEDNAAAARNALHRDAAAALIELGAPIHRIGAHMARGAAKGDMDAVHWLRRAAVDARASSPATAIELLKRALEVLDENHAERAEVLAEMITPLMWRGLLEEAESAAREALETPLSPKLRARATAELATCCMVMGRTFEAMELLTKELDAHQLSADPHVVRAFAGAAFTAGYADVATAKRFSEQVLTVAERHGDLPAQSVALVSMSQLATCEGKMLSAHKWARRAVEVQNRDPSGESLRAAGAGYALATAQLFLDDPAFDETLEREARSLARFDLPSSRLAHQIHKAFALYVRGAWDEAELEARAGADAAVELGAMLEVAHLYGVLTSIATHRGDFDLARDVLAEWDARARFPHYAAEWGRAEYLAACGRYADAVACLKPAWKERMEHGDWSPVGLAGSDLAALIVRGRDRSFSREVQGVVAQYAERTPITLYKAHALRARGLVEDDVEALIEAADAFEQTTWIVHRARASEEGAGLLLARKRSDVAGKKLLRAAIEIYEEVGAAGDLRRASALAGPEVSESAARPQRPRTGWGSLTPTEQRVLELVVERYSNGEIAEQLVVSKRTVETHIAHLFQKFGVRNRRELSDAARREQDSRDGGGVPMSRKPSDLRY